MPSRRRAWALFRCSLGILHAAAIASASAAGAQTLPLCPTCAPPGPPVDAGSSVRRDVAPAIFEIAIDSVVAQASVTVQLGNATMNGVALDYRRPVQQVAVAAGPCSVSGSLMLRIGPAPGISAVYLDGVISAPEDPAACVDGMAASPAPAATPRAFRGDLVQWRSPTAIVLLRDRHYLTPLIAVQIDVIPGQANAQAVSLSFYAGDQLLWTTLVAQSDVVTLDQDIVVGDTRIRQGARFTFTPPSPVGDGILVARSLVIVDATSTVDASGTLLTWPPPPPPALTASTVPAPLEPAPGT